MACRYLNEGIIPGGIRSLALLATPTRPFRKGRNGYGMGGNAPVCKQAFFLFRCEFAEPIGRRDSAVHEEIAAGDKRTVSTHEQRANNSHFIRCARASRRA